MARRLSKVRKGLLLALLAMALVGCRRLGVVDTTGAPSFYCEALGYRLEQRQDAEGHAIEVCVFPDGYECEEEAFLRGDCGLQYTYCARQGMLAERRESPNGATTYVQCRFPDGSFCLDFDFAFYPEKCSAARRAVICDELPGGLCPSTPVPGG